MYSGTYVLKGSPGTILFILSMGEAALLAVKTAYDENLYLLELSFRSSITGFRDLPSFSLRIQNLVIAVLVKISRFDLFHHGR